MMDTYLCLILFLLSIKSATCNVSVTFNETKHGPCDQKTEEKNLALAMFSILVFSVGVIGNVTVLITTVYSRHLRKQPSYVILSSLAVADLGVSVFVTTFKVDMYLKNGSFCHNFDLCAFLLTSDTVFPIASITHLMVICADRFYGVVFSYSYHANVTHKKQLLVTLVVWLYAVFWTSMGFFTWESPHSYAYLVIPHSTRRYCMSLNKYYYTTITVVVYIVPMAVTTTLYAVLLNVAQAANERIITLTYPTSSLKRVGSSKFQRRLDTKASKMLFIVFLAYVLCWLPNFVTVILSFWFPSIIVNFYMNYPSIYNIVTTMISNILPPINSCINPFIYFTSSKKFRHAFKDGLDKFLKKPRLPEGMSREDVLNSQSWRRKEFRGNSVEPQHV